MYCHLYHLCIIFFHSMIVAIWWMIHSLKCVTYQLVKLGLNPWSHWSKSSSLSTMASEHPLTNLYRSGAGLFFSALKAHSQNPISRPIFRLLSAPAYLSLCDKIIAFPGSFYFAFLRRIWGKKTTTTKATRLTGATTKSRAWKSRIGRDSRTLQWP